MIKNIVFDLGNVLVEFNPQKYMERLEFSKEDIDNLFQIIFKDKRWSEFDRGTLKMEDYVSELVIEHPEYKTQIETMLTGDWAKNFFIPKEESIIFLKEISNNYNIYILSNVSEYVLDYVKTLGFWNKVTSGTYSYILKHLKPEPEIYECFLKDNNLIPEECLFLDDLLQNIEAAKKLGMHGIIFTDNIDDVKAYLNEN